MSAIPKPRLVLDSEDPVSVDGPTLDAAIAAFVSQPVREHLAGRIASVTDLSEADVAGLAEAHDGTPLIVELDETNALTVLAQFAAERPDTPMLVIGDNLPGEAVRCLLQMRAADVISRGASSNEFSDSLTALLRRADEADPASGDTDGATCHAFTGAVGGSGATTLAIEMACALAARKPKRGVCLIDLNLADGMVVPFLEGKSKLDLFGLSEAPDRLDEALMRAYCWEHATGITLVAAPRDFKAHEHVSADAILNLLDVACSMFSHVVVDLSRQRLPWTEPIIAAVDEIVIVSEFTVPSLHAAADMARDFDQVRIGGSSPKLVLNRMSEGGRSFSVSKASNAIGWPIDATIRSDWKAARSAVNLGMPIRSVQEKSLLVKDVEEVVRLLAPQLSAEPEKKKKGLFR